MTFVSARFSYQGCFQDGSAIHMSGILTDPLWGGPACLVKSLIPCQKQVQVLIRGALSTVRVWSLKGALLKTEGVPAVLGMGQFRKWFGREVCLFSRIWELPDIPKREVPGFALRESLGVSGVPARISSGNCQPFWGCLQAQLRGCFTKCPKLAPLPCWPWLGEGVTSATSQVGRKSYIPFAPTWS